jgi:predicted choloylglycine hydrolase
MRLFLLRITVYSLVAAIFIALGLHLWLHPGRGAHEAVDVQAKAYTEEIEGTTVVHLKGSPYEMGFERGVLLKDLIHRSTAQFETLLELAKKEVGLPVFAAHLILDAEYRLCKPYIPARYHRELEGLADGSGVSLTVLRRMHVVSVITERSCSSFAVWGKATVDGKLLHGRNFDWVNDAGLEHGAVLVCYEPDGFVPFVSAGYAPLIDVLSGMNMEGMSIGQIGANNKDMRFYGDPLGFVQRRLLEETHNLDEATRLIKNETNTVGYNYVVADGKARKARAHETCANHCAVFEDNDPKETCEYAIRIENAVFRADEAMDPTVRGLQTCAKAPGRPYGSNSYDHRYKGMGDRIKTNYGKIDANVALDILRAVAMVDTNVHSVLYNSTDREIWVAHAKDGQDAAKQPYVHYDLNQLFLRPAARAAK